jgi:mono/diheme cytochrome c family protein
MKVFVAVAVGVLVGCGTAFAQAAQAPDPAKVAAGVKVFETQKCSQCHAIKGVGGKLSTALDGVGGKLTEADIKKWLTAALEMEAKLPKKPVMPMSTYLKNHKLTEADVEALVAYMRSLK